MKKEKKEIDQVNNNKQQSESTEKAQRRSNGRWIMLNVGSQAGAKIGEKRRITEWQKLCAAETRSAVRNIIICDHVGMKKK